MDTVSHHGRETPVRIAGERTAGPTALYVHGSGGTHRVWARQYGPNRPTPGAAALDLAGHGEAPDVDAEVDAMDEYVDDVASVADAVGADVLVGNSLGGAVVLRAVLDGRVDPGALVLAGTGAKLAVREDLRELLAEDFETAIDALHADDVLLHDGNDDLHDGDDDLRDGDDDLRERSMDTMRAVGQRVTRRDFLTCHRFDVRDRLDEIDVPALALVGEYDSLTPAMYHEFLAEEIPAGEWAVLDDAAHLAMLERPDAFNAAVGEFCERVLED